MIRWEVWIGEWCDLSWDGTDVPPVLRWRFNACFGSAKLADSEAAWYRRHGYTDVDIRMRSTRYQQRRHITTGAKP